MLVAASLFGDGASACVVGMPTADTGDYFRIEELYSAIQPDTDAEMVWTIGDHGFQLYLSSRIPDHLVEAAPQSLYHLFGDERPEFWAIHPGGRGIIDRLAEIFALEPEETTPSREVLRRVGNLSSATILFVLDEVRRQLAEKASTADARDGMQTYQGVAMAFGPGLVVEMARLSFVAERSRAAKAAIYDCDTLVASQ
jgi:predicted naringenin-chalcone synthase